MKIRTKSRQDGATLVVGLIMLIVLTMLVLSAMRSGTTNLKVVGNMQVSAEAGAAAQQAIEQIISTNFTLAPPAQQTITVDLNGDGSVTYPVVVATPSCNSTKDLKNSDLDANVAEDLVCMGSGTPQNTGIISSSGTGGTVQSWCAKQQWDVQADVTDTNSGAKVTHHQGVSLRVEVGTTC